MRKMWKQDTFRRWKFFFSLPHSKVCSQSSLLTIYCPIQIRHWDLVGANIHHSTISVYHFTTDATLNLCRAVHMVGRGERWCIDSALFDASIKKGKRASCSLAKKKKIFYILTILHFTHWSKWLSTYIK